MTTPSKPLITIGFWIVAVGGLLFSVGPVALAMFDQLATATAIDLSKWAVAGTGVGLGLMGIGKALWDWGYRIQAAQNSGTLPEPPVVGPERRI